MIILTQSVLSTQYVQVQVSATSPAGLYDPTGDAVAFAFTAAGFPATAPVTWYPGSWATYPGPAYWCQCLVGPAGGGVSLAAGTWDVWVKITDSPEVPVLQPAALVLT